MVRLSESEERRENLIENNRFYFSNLERIFNQYSVGPNDHYSRIIEWRDNSSQIITPFRRENNSEEQDFRLNRTSYVEHYPSNLITILSNHSSRNSRIFKDQDGERIRDIQRFIEEVGPNYSDFRNLREISQRIFDPDEISIDRYDDNNFLQALLQITKQYAKDYQPEFFEEQAVLLTGQPDQRLAQELAGFQDGRTETDFGVRYLRRFLKEATLLPEEELSHYALRYDIRKDNSQYGKGFSSKYFDTTFNFCLTYDDQLIASVGFDVQANRMFVHQIQGIKNNGDRLKPFKWERALLTYALEWAERFEIPELAVISVDNNHWANVKGHLTKEQGKMLYDVTARRVGLRERDEAGNYVKRFYTPLHPHPLEQFQEPELGPSLKFKWAC